MTVDDECNVDGVSETVFSDNVDECNVDGHGKETDKQQSEDPFGFYDLLNKLPAKGVRDASNLLSHPPGLPLPLLCRTLKLVRFIVCEDGPTNGVHEFLSWKSVSSFSHKDIRLGSVFNAFYAHVLDRFIVLLGLVESIGSFGVFDRHLSDHRPNSLREFRRFCPTPFGSIILVRMGGFDSMVACVLSFSKSDSNAMVVDSGVFVEALGVLDPKYCEEHLRITLKLISRNRAMIVSNLMLLFIIEVFFGSGG
ncbi:hypothetical protein Tco_0631057 [Tanacetum coccineum]